MQFLQLTLMPDAWPAGKINGIVARGGFEIDIVWAEGKLQSVVVKSKLGNPLNLRYGEIVKTFKNKKGRSFEI